MPSNDFKLAVLVSGRGSNLQAIIDSIERGDLDARVSVVLSNIADATALKRAEKHEIETVFIDPTLCADKADFDRRVIKILKARSVDLVCLAGYMRILGNEVLQAFSGRIINIHPSLLPAFPGLNPQRQAIEYGVKTSGCTVHFVDNGIDTGPIILQATVPVYETDDEESLARRILDQEHLLYPQAIQLIIEDRLDLDGRVVTQK
jgi:phosphoribosylglycinamide formyltransferase-1